MFIIRMLIINFILIAITPVWANESPYNLWNNSALKNVIYQTLQDDPEGFISNQLADYFEKESNNETMSGYRINTALQYYLMKYKGGKPFFMETMITISPEKATLTIKYQGQKLSPTDQMIYVIDKKIIMDKHDEIKTGDNSPAAIRKSILKLLTENISINSYLQDVIQNKDDNVIRIAANTRIEFFFKEYEKRISIDYRNGLKFDLQDNRLKLTVNYRIKNTGIEDQLVYSVSEEELSQRAISYTEPLPESAHVIRTKIFEVFNQSDNEELLSLISTYFEIGEKEKLIDIERIIQNIMHSKVSAIELIETRTKASRDAIDVFIKYKIKHSTSEDEVIYTISKSKMLWEEMK